MFNAHASPPLSDRSTTPVPVQYANSPTKGNGVAEGGPATLDAPTQISLTITTDPICPFNYIGYRKIDKAIAAAKEEQLPASFSIKFEPFLIDPTLPTDHCESRRVRLGKKFGPKWDEVSQMVKKQGEVVGINFDLQNGSLRSTINAHRLAFLAYAQGGESVQRRLMDLLFAGHLEYAQDIGCPTFLSHAATTAGLFPTFEEAQKWIEGSKLKEDVLKSAAKKREAGVGGVPFTVINGKYAICGAPEPEAFLEVFRKIVRGDLAFHDQVVASGPQCT